MNAILCCVKYLSTYVKFKNKIDQRTSNDEFCIIPFQANGIENNFCVAYEQDEEQYECETSSGLSNCSLGKYDHIIRDQVLEPLWININHNY